MVTVPATVGSGLMGEVEKVLKTTNEPRGYKRLVTEDGGRILNSDLSRSNPFPESICGPCKCGMFVRRDGKFPCWHSTVVYSI